MDRYLTPSITQDLKRKMVFLGGPRQVGKTTLALRLLTAQLISAQTPTPQTPRARQENHPAYFNYDAISARDHLLKGYFPTNEPLIVLDEIHKYHDWRNLIKGFYDTMKSQRTFLVTGSARLDHYSRGGDSLLGRYHYYRLHPLHLDEVNDTNRLLTFGGFPEPYFEADTREWKRWQNERRRRITTEDIASLESVQDTSKLDLMATLLPERVGSLLSVKNLAQDLNIAFATAERWLEILSAIYYSFRIKPHHNQILATTKKERKLYLWDWSLVKDAGSRYENFIASYLLKYIHFREDYYGENLELRFIRDREKREIDFVITEDGSPIYAIECKTRDHEISKHLIYFSKKIRFKQLYQIHFGEKDYTTPDGLIRCAPASKLKEIFPIEQ